MVDRIERMKLKLCVVGDKAAGKTSLLNRYVFNSFSETYQRTLGSRLCLLTVQELVAGDQLVEAKVALFDLMGERGMRDSFKEIMFWGANGFLAVADITRPETIRSLPEWIRTVQSVAGDIPFRVLLNKVDLVPSGAIRPEDTAFLMSTLPGVALDLVSAKSGAGAGEAFDKIIGTAVGAGLEKSRLRRKTRIVGERILAFAKRRGLMGIGKREILASFPEVDPNILMREVEDLHQLGLVALELCGPASFRLKLTEKGERELETLQRTARVFEETG